MDEADLLDLHLVQLFRQQKKLNERTRYRVNFALNGFEKADLIVGVTATHSTKLQAGFE